MTNIQAAIFASGTGSNFEAIMNQHGSLGCEVVLLVCDNPHAPVIKKARTRGIKTFVFHPEAYETKEAYEQKIVKQLQALNVSWIFLAGYMRIVGKTILNIFEGQIVNIHPSLLPEFPGKDAIGQAFEAGVTKTGVTIHYIDEGIDTGPIIAQQELKILPEDTRETLQTRIQKIEHEIYPKIIQQLMNQTLKMK